jgi:transglutaminase-like putative cysteine protease
MKFTIAHTLTFSLGTPPRAVMHVLMTALPTVQQRIERWSIEMPGFAEAAVFRDGFGNRAHLVSLVKPEDEIVATVSGVVETTDKAGVLGRLEYDPMPGMYRRRTALTMADPLLADGLVDGPDRIALLHELMGRVHARVEGAEQSQHQVGGQTPTPGPSPQGRGEQRQSQSQGAAGPKPAELADAFIGAVRSLDIPARHVTGYLFEAGAASFHAWAEAWDERLGWIGFDPTLNVCPAEDYVRIASGLDAMGCLPIRVVPVWGEMPVETVEIKEG